MRSLITCSILAISLAWAQHSIAAPDDSMARCGPIADVKATAKKKVTFTQLNPGQYLLVKGIYLGSSITPEGLPPGNGAMLVQDKSKTQLFWTRGDKEMCIVALKIPGPDGQTHLTYSPMMLPPEIVAILKTIGKDEIAAPTDDSKDELKL